MMDTRFSVAIHTLVLIAKSPKSMSSKDIAISTGVNASYIRKITGLLKKSGIIESHQGVSGFTLLIEPQTLTLYRIYRAIYEIDEIHLFDLHQNPNDACIVGKVIQPVLTHTFREIEEQAINKLKAETLSLVIDRLVDANKEII